MPWLTGYSDTNKINDGETVLVREQYYALAGTPADGDVIGTRRTDVVTQYRYTGMTYSAAKDCRDALNDPSGLVVAQLERQNDAGAYQVRVSETTEGAWEDIEYTAP